MEICILASGSKGNCSAVRLCRGGGVMLIDCGIGPRTAAGRLGASAASLAEVSAICLTHLDGDHFNRNWVSFINQRQIDVFCHESRAEELAGLAGDGEFARRIRTFNGQAFEPIAQLACLPIALAHDEHGSHGFVIKAPGSRIAYATDLGHVTERLIRRFCGSDIVALESNYDPEMELASNRPEFLKRRIMGGRGHLSNQQAFEALVRILDRSRSLPRHVVLLHRSQQCNGRELLRRFFSRDDRIAGRLTLAEQHRPTGWLAGGENQAWRQLELAFG